MVDTLRGYQDYLARLPLSGHTKRNYLGRIKAYLEWLAASPEGTQALEDAHERDFFIRDYKAHLLLSGRSSATVNAALASLDSFYQHLGLGPAKIRRQDLPAQAPKALEADEQRRFIREVMRSKSKRNQLIALVMVHAGLRIAEVAGLNVGDVFVTARKGELLVRCGKGNKQRRIPMNSELREAMLSYLRGPQLPDTPLFKSQRGTRISVNAVAHVIKQFAKDAGIEMTSHSLRHTALTRLIRSGCDIVIVAEVAGHARLETTRRYSLPSLDDKIRAMEQLTYAKTTQQTG